MSLLKHIRSVAVRQALLLLLIAALLGLTANRFNPRGVAFGLAAPVRSGGLAWDESEVTDTPRSITLAQLQPLIKRGAVLLIDARCGAEYRPGHLPGAISLPWENYFEHLDRVHSFPKNLWLVCYCDGGECELSSDLAQELLLQGFRKVAVYRGGIEEWQLSNALESGEEKARD